MRLALLSDTHGLLRPEVLGRIEGVDRILHAGDVGPADLLLELEAIAPVTAVWGNTDGFELRHRVPEVAGRNWEGYSVVLLHGHQLGTPTPERLAELHPTADLVVFGHTHVPVIRREGSVLVVNPGSCGHRRNPYPPTLVLATLAPEGIRTELVELPDTPPHDR